MTLVMTWRFVLPSDAIRKVRTQLTRRIPFLGSAVLTLTWHRGRIEDGSAIHIQMMHMGLVAVIIPLSRKRLDVGSMLLDCLRNLDSSSPRVATASRYWV